MNPDKTDIEIACQTFLRDILLLGSGDRLLIYIDSAPEDVVAGDIHACAGANGIKADIFQLQSYAGLSGMVDALCTQMNTVGYDAVCELSGHRKLLDVWLTLVNQLRVFLTIEKDFFGPAFKYVSTHHPILEAIKIRNKKRAEKEIREHLKLAMRVIREGYWAKPSNRLRPAS